MACLRCGVIGLGRLGFKHAQNLAGRIENARLVAVSDPSEEARNHFSSRFSGIDLFADHQDLLRRKDLDAVVIASATNTHGGIILDALKAGKPVFCEKPVTLDRLEGAKLRKTLAEVKGYLMVGFMRRFDDAYLMGKKQIDSGRLGEPVYVRGISRDPGSPPIEFAKASGGLVLDMCVHDIDLSRWFIGSEVSRVSGEGAVLMWPELGEIGDIDHVDIEFRFKNGRLAHLEGSRNARYGYDIRTEVICTKGSVFIGDLRQTACLVLNDQGSLTDIIPEFRTRFDKAYLTELEAFVEDVLNEREPSVTLEDGITAVELCFAVNESLKQRKVIEL
ncbi:MAG: Gfo/Idh/MocA family oxidoreductase [Spirochaetaceae bacterium]|jgi:scyllo-inositol 2-dehydrogenase (NAD+)|nr:Gfo/Idh/MocA family oxidoreductase [Spirochaetaceae bacterium]